MEHGKESTAIEGFKVLEYVQQQRERIARETEGMNFTELKKYFEDRVARAGESLKHEN